MSSWRDKPFLRDWTARPLRWLWHCLSSCHSRDTKGETTLSIPVWLLSHFWLNDEDDLQHLRPHFNFRKMPLQLPAECPHCGNTAVGHFWWKKMNSPLYFAMSTSHTPHVSTSGSWKRKEKKAAYAVALHPNEVHRQRDWFIAVLVQCFDVVQQVRKELVAPFQHTQGHDVVPPHVPDDVSGQSLCSGPERRGETHKENRCLVNVSAIFKSSSCDMTLHFMLKMHFTTHCAGHLIASRPNHIQTHLRMCATVICQANTV